MIGLPAFGDAMNTARAGRRSGRRRRNGEDLPRDFAFGLLVQRCARMDVLRGSTVGETCEE
jgi:hypothetical protein